MRLTPNDRDISRIVAICSMAIVGAASIGLAVLFGQHAAAEIRQKLSVRSQLVAAALGPNEVMQLQGQSTDEQSAAYTALKATLAATAQADSTVRSIYLTGQRGERLFFYVDSEQPDSPDYSPAAEWYDDATSDFKAIFTNGRPLVEGPIRDEYGTFISGLAPIFKPGTKEVAAVIGIDVSAATYWRDVMLSASIPLFAGASIMAVIAVFEWIRRRNLELIALKSELMSVASHELRTPITGIRWAAESIEKLNKQKNLRRLIHAISGSAQNLQASTDDILELSQTMNQSKLDLHPTDVKDLMQEVIETQNLSAEQKNVTIHTDTSWPTSIVVNCDADKLKRALHNVISNAIKYTGQGTTVTISYKLQDGMHRISIRDEGIGIPLLEQDKIFKGFYRASNAVRSKVPGTGLGLFLVHTVLEQHGGTISFTSEQNKGTTFTLSLPNHK